MPAPAGPTGPAPDSDAGSAAGSTDAVLTGLMARAAAVAQVLVADPGDPVVDPDDRHHLARVLRLRPGEPVIATDGRGSWSSCRYRGDGDRALEPDGPTMFEPPLRPALAVAFAPAKGDRPEWVVQKLTELGIDRIVPLATARSVVRWDRDRDRDRADRAVARLGRVAREAAGQSRRVWLPEVTGVRTLATLADDLTRPADRGSGGPAGGEGLALAQLGGDRPTAATTVVAVGPEGGWAPEELAIGTATVGLGPSVLRAETAALAAGAILAGLRAGTVGVEDA